MTRPRGTFVYAATGNTHIDQVNLSLRFLKRFARTEIVVVAARYQNEIDHDQVIRMEYPEYFDDHQASILMKTSLHRILGYRNKVSCYLDSDLIAVHDGVERIFEEKRGPVTFSTDRSRMPSFSRFAVRCACVKGQCDHLRDAIHSKFRVPVSDPNWQHWNGGVFLFDSESAAFLDKWHAYTCAIFKDSYWKTRDQGTLIATVWSFGLQNQPTLDRKYNYIVDCMLGLSDAQRAACPPSSYHVDHTYSLESPSSSSHPYFLHFINGGSGHHGWRNWDDAAAKLDTAPHLDN